ncbi:MAG: efflux transporter periplasmic adaptor subunit [Gammaproteobacteria bacterium]|nr:MAG: efflux transporter periplasmic adaptor subunit [Gammaproteobacteria bacterium]
MKQESHRLWADFSGHLTAVNFVEIRPQASGIITEIKFEDGQQVKKDDILYIIDPRPFKAIVDQKKADLTAARNESNFAEKEYKRTIDLIDKKVVSQQALDERLNSKLVAISTIRRAEAELAEAQVNLSYAYIKAPISGTTSRTELTVGNLVSSGSNAPLLTSIVANESIYADFEIDEKTYLRYRSQTTETAKNPVELTIQNGEYTYQGTIHDFDNKIDPASGTIRARAIFDNPTGQLLSGMYARLKLGSAIEYPQILLTERAIATDQSRKFVYIISDENKTTYREVKLGNSIDGKRIILSGLAVGDKVVTRGLMRIRPGMLVDPQEPKATGDAQ